MKGRDIILGLLHKKKRTGYEINEVFKTIFSHFFNGTYGMIYPTLKKLEKEKVIDKEVVFQEGKPNRNVFSISEVGTKEFFEYLISPVQPEIRQSDFLMRMYFGEFVENEVVIQWINDEIKQKTEQIDQLKTDYIKWKDKLTYTQKISYDIGIAQYEAEIQVLQAKLVEMG
ncbi:PadR family transcriptional regulator [Paenibacillus agri]|uniref:PadR family transcriptional regulator n=1 Tax=Paenibacillus agri TaxID=2744309 RepID=A0A850ERD0_9BACL|nr:PadR family transcriptional regulator [Paenibacillus agri]NUU60581.1 PadR family transcriptional regulator [Paenibacillus agri]